MSNDNSLPKPIAMIIGITTSIITFITAIVGFILLWKGNEKVVSAVVLAVGILGLWSSFFYIRFSSEGIKSKRKGKSGFAFSEASRRFALFGIYLLPLLSIIGLGVFNYNNNKPTSDITILLADFDGPEPQKYGVTQFLVENIRKSTENLEDVNIIVLNQSITATQGFQRATELGKAAKADLIIWGWYVATEQGISVTYHIGDLNFLTGFGTTTSVDYNLNLQAPIEQVNTFDFQSNKLVDNILLDTQHSIYRVFNSREEQEKALEVIEFTLEYLENHADSYSDYEGIHTSLLSLHAYTVYKIFGYDEAISEINEIILLSPTYEALINRATIYSAEGNYQLAINDYLEAKEYSKNGDTSFFHAYFGLGTIYERQSKFKEAIEIYTEGIERTTDCTISNGCHLFYFRRGLNYLQLGDKLNAEKDLFKARDMLNDPSFSTFFDNLLK